MKTFSGDGDGEAIIKEYGSNDNLVDLPSSFTLTSNTSKSVEAVSEESQIA